MSEKDKKNLPDVEIGTSADMDEVMRKFDRESATRIWQGKPKLVVGVVISAALSAVLNRFVLNAPQCQSTGGITG